MGDTKITYDFFILSDQRLTVQQYAWYVFGHAVLLLLSHLLIEKTGGYSMVKVFYWLQWLYFIDFLITQNGNWFWFLEVHIVSMAIFVTAWLRYGGDHNNRDVRGNVGAFPHEENLR